MVENRKRKGTEGAGVLELDFDFRFVGIEAPGIACMHHFRQEPGLTVVSEH